MYRKPVALKAVYYLIEKRLKQGLSYPEIDFNLNEHNDNSNAILQAKPSNNSNNSLFSNNNTNTINSAKISNSNSNNGVTKQSSQLLPKRHSTVQLMPRSGSQKNVDFKSIFNNMNMNTANVTRYSSNVSRESDRTTNNNNNTNMSNSPSPDFIAAAMTPAKNTSNQNVNSASSQRNSRQATFQDNRNKVNSNTSNYSANLNHHNENNNKTDRYYMPASSNGDENGHQQAVMYYQQGNGVTTNGILKSGVANGGIRSLPGSVYRGSPERSLPRSPERQNDNTSINTNYRPTSRISSSRPSVSELQQTTTDKNFDAQKFRVANYLATKRSLTSCEESHPHESATNASKQRSSAVVKNRSNQLQMGKAKIDLETQNSINTKFF